MEVNVGQIVFVLNAKNRSLLPAQVDEVVVSRTVRGETTQHILVLQNEKRLILEKLQTPWFTELSFAKDYLLLEAEKMIDTVITAARDSAATHFDTSIEPTGLESSVVKVSEVIPQNSEKITIDLGDGQTARVTLPEDFAIESTSS
jgi:hypothetical protein